MRQKVQNEIIEESIAPPTVVSHPYGIMKSVCLNTPPFVLWYFPYFLSREGLSRSFPSSTIYDFQVCVLAKFIGMFHPRERSTRNLPLL